MRTLLARFARPLLAFMMIGATAIVAGAQQAPPPPPMPAPPAVAPALTPAQRAVYVGVYTIDTPDGAMRVDIFEEGERLMGRPETSQEASILTPLGNHRFVPVLMNESVMTFTVDGNRATAFQISFPDERGTMTAVRRP